MDERAYNRFFCEATGSDQPFDYQRRLALEGERLPELLHIPTGAGKTAAIILGWLWRRRFSNEKTRAATPRRLVYCLPMRVLVEQTRDNAILWLQRLDLLGGKADVEGEPSKERVKGYTPSWDERPVDGWARDNGDKGRRRIAVTVLMGGEDKDEWDLYPERDAIIIGTQDMLLSRALNRGYGMSRYRWPMHFGLLNNDCLWVMDEVQLMGNGLATTAQLQAFRQKMGTMALTHTVWMSATLDPEWLKTVDFNTMLDEEQPLSLSPADMQASELSARFHAIKKLTHASSTAAYAEKLVEEILKEHRPASRTLVIVNTVARAAILHKMLRKRNPKADMVLVHSHFRPPDRKEVIHALLEDPSPEGTIVISTQVIEAGIDVSGRVLFTELAPWPSLVQRFGRCNRLGKDADAKVFWIDVPTGAKKSLAPPYTDTELDAARSILIGLEDKSVGPDSLPEVPMKFEHGQVVRRKDVIELFDTSSDLAGRDIDVSRFIREILDTDVQVFWRELPKEGPGDDEPKPDRNELCTAPISDIHNLVKKKTDAWVWDWLDSVWAPVRASTPIYPGIALMLRASGGRYTKTEGWDVRSKSPVPIIQSTTTRETDEYSTDLSSMGEWMSISEHTDRVVVKASEIAGTIEMPQPWLAALLETTRWHDAGKAHKSFQAMIDPEMLRQYPNLPVAKAPKDAWRTSRLPRLAEPGEARRKYFRHELASGLLALQHGKDDLIAYLAAAHHGKVRLSIRSMPDEYRPPSEGTRFARGVWDGDVIPGTSLGGGVGLPTTVIDLSPMELGRGQKGPSWLARMLSLRDRPDLGPFRLAFLESLLKASDERASGGRP